MAETPQQVLNHTQQVEYKKLLGVIAKEQGLTRENFERLLKTLLDFGLGSKTPENKGQRAQLVLELGDLDHSKSTKESVYIELLQIVDEVLDEREKFGPLHPDSEIRLGDT